jgi:hypothetical protein
MAEPKERRSNRSRKPKIHFDEIAQPSGPSKPSKPLSKPSKAPSKPSTAPNASTKPTPTTKPTEKPPPTAKSNAKPSKSPTNLPISDPVEDLYSQTAKLDIKADIKAKKQAKLAEIARLSKLGFQGVLEEIKPLKEVEFEPFILGDHREPKVNIPSNIDTTDPLALLDLFIPPEMYATIAENTNLYAISKNAPMARTKSNSRYWWPTNENEIRVLFGILYYMGIHREPNYRIYWETPKPNGPIHALSKHMTLNRYKNLWHFLHVSKPAPEPSMENKQPLPPSIPLTKAP